MRVPVQHWLHGPLRRLARKVLLGRECLGRGLFRPKTIKAWMRGDGLIWSRHGAALWLVLTLELWLQAYVDYVDPPLQKCAELTEIKARNGQFKYIPP